MSRKKLILCNLICSLVGLEIDSCYYDSAWSAVGMRKYFMSCVTEMNPVEKASNATPCSAVMRLQSLHFWYNPADDYSLNPHVLIGAMTKRRNRNIVTINMIRGPCGTLNQNSPCMENALCDILEH
ncbi:unnamed protein product [Onchocerca ochengi]|uniref:SCP domain-containing protein n=1 Tax=Onchocerca ochengi TaxID=42157 RepID=A0A182DWL4_ONCOC|nr:unnamed protein product [Onchocerca ochengi]